MNKYYEQANKLQAKMIEQRRDLHQMPELGLDLPKTSAYVEEKLKALGLEVKRYGTSGLSATIKGGKGEGKTILLRADMDALPMEEINDLDFKAEGTCAHTCGHDLHTAMLLAAAEIINDNKDDFKGNVKLMFQPAEEIFKGSRMMIEEGLLEDPKVDVAFAMHTGLDHLPGSISYNTGYMTTSCDNFKIEIKGKGAHGAYPHTGIDPINAGVLIYQQFAQLISRDNTPQATTTLTFGQFSAGSNSNIIPDTAVMQGTMRTYDPEVRDRLKKRMIEIIEGAEKVTGTKIDLDFFSGVPSTYSNPELTGEFVDIIKNANPDIEMIDGLLIMASEDFAVIAEKVPSVYIMCNCKVEGNNFSHHNPGVLFNEDAMPIGAGTFASFAIEWLNKN